MKVKIIFDKAAENNKLHTGWGVSFLINERILFDAGENGSWLAKNMKTVSINRAEIDSVVISHDHWDHTGGLQEILKTKKRIRVYGCPNFSNEFKKKTKQFGAEFIETGNFAEIAKDIFVTGEISGEYKGEYMPEQALVIRTVNGLTIITGCAHPGIVKIVKTVKGHFPKEKIYFVFGGFHLLNEDTNIIKLIIKEFRKLNIEKVGPTHCSGSEAEELFEKEYRDNFVSILVGKTLEI